MSYTDEIRRQAETAPCAALPAVAAALWKAFGEGQVSEGEAEALSVFIESRRASESGRILGQSPNPTGTDRIEETSEPRELVQAARRAVGSRPRTDASLERRRRWAASGRLPPGLAARFTLAEQAVLALVAAEIARRKDCRLAVGHLAAIAGVAETTVRNAIREARKLGLVTVEERRVTGFRNDTNILRIVSAEWIAWLRLTRRGSPSGHRNKNLVSELRGGCRSAQRTPTKVLILSELGKTEPSECCRGAADDLDRSEQPRIRAGGGTGRAMR